MFQLKVGRYARQRVRWRVCERWRHTKAGAVEAKRLLQSLALIGFLDSIVGLICWFVVRE